MDWRTFLCFGSYLILLTGFIFVHGHPLRNHHKKSHILSRKAKINRIPQNINRRKQKKSYFYPGKPFANSATTEDAKKKGTIRISGPWHTDSGLDRNVDPMEDSYVKKIISSNEGLNFNKDMAEAGEVFDVNGIEDFYDRNALITYEVNGHEIPVHLKQKLTPQTQPMFPEYGHDSPAAPDMTSSRTGHAYAHRNPSSHRATTFYGMSLKDMPEYKVHDTPSVDDKNHPARLFSGRARMNSPQFGEEGTFSSRQRLASSERPGQFDPSVIMPPGHTERAAEAQSQADKLSSEYEEANQVGQEDVRLSNRIQDSNRAHFVSNYHKLMQAPDTSVAGFNQRLAPGRFHDNQDQLADNEGERLKEFAAHTRFQNQEELLEELARLKSQKTNNFFQKPSHFHEHFKKRPSDSVEFADRPKPSLGEANGEQFIKNHEVKQFFGKENSGDESEKSADIGGDDRGVGKEYDGSKLTPAAVQPNKGKDEEKADDSNKFFEQLEKIDEQKQKSEREKQEMLPGNSAEPSVSLLASADKIQRFSDDEERSKAKDKLLRILGDLTSKLKGMEAAVKDTHTDERRESQSDSHDEKQEEMEHKVAEQAYAENKQREDSSAEEAKMQKAREAETLEHSQGSIEHKYPETARYQDEKLSEHPEPAYESEHAHPSNNDMVEVSQDKVSHLISSLKQHDKPFIFNTEEIDYKDPGYEEKAGRFTEDDSQSKDHVHRKFGHGPIVSSFYRETGANQNNEFDVHRFHSETGALPDKEVTPTQRDGGRQGQKIAQYKEHETSPDAEKKPEVQQHHESDSKSDPDDDLPDYNEVKDAAIFEENLIRKKYHAPNLRWSDDLSDEAQREADDLADEKSLDLSKKSLPKGMNIAMVPINSLNVGKDSADLWQKESTKFDFVSPFITKKNTDFAQMVWKTAKEFGLGVAKTKDKDNWIVVAKYDTPILAEFEKLKANIESDIPVTDPYSDIARRGRIANDRS